MKKNFFQPVSLVFGLFFEKKSARSKKLAWHLLQGMCSLKNCMLFENNLFRGESVLFQLRIKFRGIRMEMIGSCRHSFHY